MQDNFVVPSIFVYLLTATQTLTIEKFIGKYASNIKIHPEFETSTIKTVN
jgi:hypothetical protein